MNPNIDNKPIDFRRKFINRVILLTVFVNLLMCFLIYFIVEKNRIYYCNQIEEGIGKEFERNTFYHKIIFGNDFSVKRSNFYGIKDVSNISQFDGQDRMVFKRGLQNNIHHFVSINHLNFIISFIHGFDFSTSLLENPIIPRNYNHSNVYLFHERVLYPIFIGVQDVEIQTRNFNNQYINDINGIIDNCSESKWMKSLGIDEDNFTGKNMILNLIHSVTDTVVKIFSNSPEMEINQITDNLWNKYYYVQRDEEYSRSPFIKNPIIHELVIGRVTFYYLDSDFIYRIYFNKKSYLKDLFFLFIILILVNILLFGCWKVFCPRFFRNLFIVKKSWKSDDGVSFFFNFSLFSDGIVEKKTENRKEYGTYKILRKGETIILTFQDETERYMIKNLRSDSLKLVNFRDGSEVTLSSQL